MTRSHAFSRALRQPHVITSSFDWFNVLSVSYVIGQSNYFGFGFTTLKRKPLYKIDIGKSLTSLTTHRDIQIVEQIAFKGQQPLEGTEPSHQ